MAEPVLMPQQGNTVEECLLTRWRKKVGDTVAQGEILADIETDKATFELEAPLAGTLLACFCNEGELVPVKSVIAVLGKPGEPVEQFRPSKTETKSAARTDAAVSSPDGVLSGQKPETEAVHPSSPQKSSTAQNLSPRAQTILARKGISLKGVRGTGAEGRVTSRDLANAQSPRLSPTAADLARQGHRAPDSGSGPNGLILSSDLLPPGKPLTGIRAIIAERMHESLLTTAQYTITMRAKASGLLAARKKIKPLATAGKLPDITINDLVMFAVVAVLKEFPDFNAELIDNEVTIHRDINLGFACDTPRGLMVPVVKKCQELKIADLAKRSRDLADKAIQGKISPDDLTGGTFTVSNLGGLGVVHFTPVINAPQVAILGVCAIETLPVRTGDTVAFEDFINLSLTSDHQVIDGAVAARFLKRLTAIIESIETLAALPA